jgi:uncharacterized protein YqeY
MGLTEKINQGMKDAMKSGEKLKLDTLRLLRAQIIEFEKRGLGRAMNEDDDLVIVISSVKKHKESIEQYKLAGRSDLVEREEKELDIISEFLPKQISAAEAESIITGIISTAGASSPKDLSRVMPLAMKELKGKFDSKHISEMVKLKLGG